MPSAPSIRIDHRPSRWQAGLTFALVVVAGAALLLAPWPFWLRATLFVLYLVVVATAWRHRGGPRWSTLIWRGDGSWCLIDPAEREHEVPLRESRLFGPLIVLRLDAPDAGTVRVLLWPDSGHADDLRRLRIRLAREQGRRAGQEDAP